MAKWFVIKNEKEYGLFHSEHLRRLARQQKLSPDYLVSCDDVPTLRKASEIRGLFTPNQLASAANSSQTDSQNSAVDTDQARKKRRVPWFLILSALCPPFAILVTWLRSTWSTPRKIATTSVLILWSLIGISLLPTDPRTNTAAQQAASDLQTARNSNSISSDLPESKANNKLSGLKRNDPISIDPSESVISTLLIEETRSTIPVSGERGFSLSPTGDLLLINAYPSCQLWNTETGQQIPIHPEVTLAKLSPDGNILAGISLESIRNSGSDSRRPKLILQTFEVTASKAIPKESLPIEIGRGPYGFGKLRLIWSPSGRHLFLMPNATSQTISETDWYWTGKRGQDGAQAWATFEEVTRRGIQPERVMAIAEIVDFANRPLRSTLVTDPLRTSRQHHLTFHSNEVFSSPHKDLFALNFNGLTCFYDVGSGDFRQTCSFEDEMENSDRPRIIGFSPRGTYFAAQTRKRKPAFRDVLTIWKTDTFTKLFTVTAETDGLSDLYFSADESVLSVTEPGGKDTHSRLFSLPDGEMQSTAPLFTAKNSFPNGLRFGWSLVAFNRGPIEVWNRESRWPVAIVGRSDNLDRRWRAISADGKTVATSYRDAEAIEIWKIKGNNKVPLNQYRKRNTDPLPKREFQQYFTLTQEEIKEGWSLPSVFEPAPKISRATFNRLKLGMNQDQVRSLLGGAPHKVLGRVSSNREGSLVQQATWAFTDIEVYAGEVPGSIVILLFRKDSNYRRLTLIDIEQRGLE